MIVYDLDVVTVVVRVEAVSVIVVDLVFSPVTAAVSPRVNPEPLLRIMGEQGIVTKRFRVQFRCTDWTTLRSW